MQIPDLSPNLWLVYLNFEESIKTPPNWMSWKELNIIKKKKKPYIENSSSKGNLFEEVNKRYMPKSLYNIYMHFPYFAMHVI